MFVCVCACLCVTGACVCAYVCLCARVCVLLCALKLAHHSCVYVRVTYTHNTHVYTEACTTHNCRVGQNHTYTVHTRYFWQGNHQIYDHIRCKYRTNA